MNDHHKIDLLRKALQSLIAAVQKHRDSQPSQDPSLNDAHDDAQKTLDDTAS